MRKFRNKVDRVSISNILVAYRAYVNHSDIIHRRGNPSIYRRLDRLRALDKCIFYSRWFVGKTNKTIAKIILNNEENLAIILPDQSNLSYNSSCLNLINLLQKSKEILEQKN